MMVVMLVTLVGLLMSRSTHQYLSSNYDAPPGLGGLGGAVSGVGGGGSTSRQAADHWYSQREKSAFAAFNTSKKDPERAFAEYKNFLNGHNAWDMRTESCPQLLPYGDCDWPREWKNKAWNYVCPNLTPKYVEIDGWKGVC